METMVSFKTVSETGTSSVALMLATGLSEAGIESTRPEQIGSAWRSVARVGTARVPVLVGMAGESDRWLVSIGTGLMPAARLLGVKDAEPRAQVTAAILTILDDSPYVSDIESRDGVDPADG